MNISKHSTYLADLLVRMRIWRSPCWFALTSVNVIFKAISTSRKSGSTKMEIQQVY